MTNPFKDFCEEMAKPRNAELSELFCASMEAFIMDSAVAAARDPVAGVGQWAGGRISVCDELVKGLMVALAKAKSDAKDGAYGESPPDLD